MYLSAVSVSFGSTGLISNLDPSINPHLLKLPRQLLKISYTPISDGGGINCLISTRSRNAESCDEISCGRKVEFLYINAVRFTHQCSKKVASAKYHYIRMVPQSVQCHKK